MSENEVVTKSPGSLLADEMYGTPEPAISEPEPVAQHATLAEETEDAEGQGIRAEEAVEETQQEVVEGATEEEGVEVTTIEQLAEHLEADLDWLQDLTISQKVNGQPMQVKLADALSTHRQVEAADQVLSNAKAKAKEMQAQLEVERQTINEGIVSVGTMLQALESELENDAKSIDWSELRRQDPAEYSAKKDEVRERRDRIRKMRDDAVAQYQAASLQLAQQQEAERIARLPQEQEILVERIPEWADDEKASQERAALVDYLYEDGFTQEEIEFISWNGKYLAPLIKAMRYDKSKGKVDTVKKKVRKIPKVLKPGSDKATDNPSKPKSDDLVDILYG